VLHEHVPHDRPRRGIRCVEDVGKVVEQDALDVESQAGDVMVVLPTASPRCTRPIARGRSTT